MANRCFAKCVFFRAKFCNTKFCQIRRFLHVRNFVNYKILYITKCWNFAGKKIWKNHEIFQDVNRNSPNFISRRNYEKISRNLLRQGSGSRLTIKVFMNKFLSVIPPEQVETFWLKTPGLCSVNTLL